MSIQNDPSDHDVSSRFRLIFSRTPSFMCMCYMCSTFPESHSDFFDEVCAALRAAILRSSASTISAAC